MTLQTEPFVGEIRLFAGNFAPSGFALCNGQLLPISQNTALFSLLGTNYGGNGTTTFGLPNLQGRTPMHKGQGPGLSSEVIGEMAGVEAVTLNATQIAAHSHPVNGANVAGNQVSPVNNTWAQAGRTTSLYAASGANNAQMNAAGTNLAGGGLPHNNRPPYQAINFIIALQGIFPPRP